MPNPSPKYIERLEQRVNASPLFLLLGLGFSEDWSIHNDSPPEILCTIADPSCRIRRVMLVEDDEELAFQQRQPKASQERLVIQIRDLNAAIRVTNAIQALFVHLQRMLWSDDFSIYRIPRRGFIRNRIIYIPDLVRLEDLVPQYSHDSAILEARLKGLTIVPESKMAFLFFLLPTVLASPALFDACHFFEASSRDFNFIGDVVTNIAQDPDRTPATQQERLRLEGVVLNAFRTIEAIVGEPGRENRFRQRLADNGIEFDEPVGFRGFPAEPIGRRIYVLQELRDGLAAHGRRRRPAAITYFEVSARWRTSNSQVDHGAPDGREARLGEIRFVKLRSRSRLLETRFRGAGKTVHQVAMSQALCVASKQYSQARFEKDIEYIHRFLSENKVTSERGVTADHFHDHFTPDRSWDIVHLGRLSIRRTIGCYLTRPQAPVKWSSSVSRLSIPWTLERHHVNEQFPDVNAQFAVLR